MRLSNKAEEILEYLWIMIREMGEERVSLKELKTDRDAPEIQELMSLNYIDVSPDSATLREEGMGEAESAVRRHRLAERLMVDVFDLDRGLMEENACLFEHLLRREVEESICTLLGHPGVCPHNRPIPAGRCCRDSVKTARNIVSSLADVKRGVKGRVAYLHTRDNKKLQKLMTMGILPGVTIEVMQTFPSYVFRLGHTQIAVDKEMATDIFMMPGR
ncbi:MAG: metal-dependent transcriptional regulator [Nitrospirota bacterium]|nr:metal-dependent transcriptional regulator [Nitrospirota bacterium]